MKTKTTDAEKTIFEILKENTGINMLDSGGDNGRLWQRNAKKTLKDFQAEPEVSYDVEYGTYTISVFHYLVRDLELDHIAETFNRTFVPAKDWDGGEIENVYGVSKAGVEWLKEQGFRFKQTFNSCNGDSNISQVIQGTWLETEDRERYLILQIHGGADVRGGYTDARLFRCPHFEEGALMEDVSGYVKKADGSQINVDNRYNGYSLTDDNGDEVKIEKTDKVYLSLMER